jgi:hypothetical protein
MNACSRFGHGAFPLALRVLRLKVCLPMSHSHDWTKNQISFFLIDLSMTGVADPGEIS